MGVFLQIALFPGCTESAARAAVETAAKNPGFCIDPGKCKFAQNYEGTQVLIEGNGLGSAPLAKALSTASVNPVMLLYIYDGDYWGYDFYSRGAEDHFNTFPDYFGPISREEKQRMAGDPAALSGWFPFWDVSVIRRYYVHWSDLSGEELEEAGFAYPGDQYPYGDCWQMIDFAARLGFPWAFEGSGGVSAPLPMPVLPTLREILEQSLPPIFEDDAPGLWLLDNLPSALSPEYIWRLLEETGVREFDFPEKTPEEIIDAVQLYRQTVNRPECDHRCQRLAVLAAFCTFWLKGALAWGFLDCATYEPVSVSHEKPSDVCVLRARAALTDFTKRHRAIRDLNRLIELDPANGALYMAELRRWDDEERAWETQAGLRHEAFLQQFAEKKRREEEREARRLRLILEKRRKKKP